MNQWDRQLRPGGVSAPGHQGDGAPEHVLPPDRVLVPMLVVGAALALLTLLVSGYLEPAGWTRLVMAGCALVSLLAAWLIHSHGLNTLTLVALVAWGDCATVVVAHALGAEGAVGAQLVLFTLPNLIMACYGGRGLLAGQALASVVGAGLILSHVDVPPARLVLHSAMFAFATICPAIAVLVLRERLESIASADRARAVTDHLTSVMNRRGLEEAMPRLIARARAVGVPIGVVILDLDHFKSVNDRFGHATGDAVLQRVAGILCAAAGTQDPVARLGGEEFAILTVRRPMELAALAERVRGEVARAGAALGVTVSVGVAWDDTDGVGSDPVERMWTVIDRADALMFAAKRGGRDRVRVEHA